MQHLKGNTYFYVKRSFFILLAITMLIGIAVGILIALGLSAKKPKKH